jgi:hypothetical protein
MGVEQVNKKQNETTKKIVTTTFLASHSSFSPFLCFLFFVLCSLLIVSCAAPQSKQTNLAPLWVSNLERAYPSKDWVAVTAQGSSQAQAESLAMNALARAYRTDITSLTQSSQQYSEIVNNGANTYEKAFSSVVNGTTYNILAFNPWAYNAERYFYSDTNSTLLAYSVQIETPTALRGNEILGNVDITIQKPANGVKLYLLVK